MKKFMNLFTAIILLLAYNNSDACTNLIVTRGASSDGSIMITYSADSYNMYGELYHFKAAIYPNGAKLEVYEWDTGKYLGTIPQAKITYNVVGNINEHQVVIGETTFTGRKELIDSKEVVPGDIVFLEEGAKVPADIRVLKNFSLKSIGLKYETG